ncbi:DUF2865 domain-containing protein [Rhizobium sp. L1K21]|uniref:DUF2865 domain-containing protein n=1 Tax=Rhizobium sp. L1K21 TaxID=2954933 RepID=UPI002092A102|nr:DUF2865 domain-containing protein [Rhizobium sp. L1K21]MCO6186318.1 DUF2865 domain-containing protein [Rhizobium sp. L1K21]
MRNVAKKVAISALLLAALWPVGSEAATICQRLNAKLSSATVTIGNTQSARKYSQAITRQQREMRKVQSDLRSLGCSSGSVIVFGGANAQNCKLLSTTLDRMERNLETLERQRKSLVSPSLSKSARKRILASLEANGCNGLKDAEETAGDQPQKQIELAYNSISTPETLRQLNDAEPQSYQITSLGGVGEHGNLRTVCVRTCDGGFFPISSNATPADFARDAQVCSMMCPGVSTQLFYHALYSQESGQMMSTVNGTPYEEMPFAYKYRNGQPNSSKACSCNFSAYYREMLRREGGQAVAKTEKTDQSSIADLREKSGLRDSLPAESGATLMKLRPYDPDAVNIRKVGPEFLPEESSLDLANPATGAISDGPISDGT